LQNEREREGVCVCVDVLGLPWAGLDEGLRSGPPTLASDDSESLRLRKYLCFSGAAMAALTQRERA
jgi:hypothetical protein